MKPSLVLLFPFVLILCGPASASAQEALPKAQADAVAAIKKLGGYVILDKTSGEVDFINFGGTPITDAGLVHLKGMTSLTYLILYSTQITDAGLEHLQGMTSLTTLGLEFTRGFTDARLAEIKAALPNCETSR